MRLQVFASGSKGNSLAVSSCTGTTAIVDLGLSCRELCRRMKACAVDPAAAAAVLFTHDHADHCAALATFHDRFPSVPLFANFGTAQAISRRTGVMDGWRLFETASTFRLGDLSVRAFSVPHDAADPVGYLIGDGRSALFVGTDFGTVTMSVRSAFSQADCAVLESNHDLELLLASDRPVSLKQRIAGRSGHLSNDDAAELAATCASPRLKSLFLAHLSEQCNDPALAVRTVRAALGVRTDVAVAALAQGEPAPAFEF